MYIPEHFKEVSKGVIVRKEINNPQTIDIQAHYENDAINILVSDNCHYSGLYSHILNVMPELSNAYYDVVSIGGGNPKFEVAILKAVDITVLDGFADSYKAKDTQFRQIFNISEDVNIDYRKCDLSSPFSPTIPLNSCVSFVHFLEHCDSWETVKAWIKDQESDIVIYGPNIEVAQDADWFHFRPKDHNVFFTIEAIAAYAKEIGYTVESIAYSDDMLIWLRN